MAGKRSTARAEVVGSLLQPERLLAARTRLAAGEIDVSELAAIEDEAVLECISIQEGAGLDVITDGEMRRPGWADTARHLGGLEARPGERSYPANVRMAAGGGGGGGSNSAFTGGFPTVVGKIHPLEGYKVGEEYPYLTNHTTSRTKYTMAAPSYHRRYWSDELSTSAYPSCEDFLSDVHDWLHGVAQWLVSQGCDYIQLDAPNYGSLCDPDNRAFHKERGHDLDAQLVFDGKLDSSVFEGLDVTRALHVCRGNMPGGTWHSSGGYGAISDQLFPNLDVDVVLLEYDSDRAGDFGPIGAIDDESIVVLGLLTTKAGELEDRGVVESRIAEAGRHHPAANFALSTQCGFASAANAPMSSDEQRAKLQLISDVAHSTWS